MDSLTQHVFATLTYKRDNSVSKKWESISKDFNRYIQRLRRLHNSRVQYLRAIEAHRDSFPHIHVILQFNDPITVSNGRYFDRNLFAKWKQLWSSGLSDYQAPHRSKIPVLYLIKYISKNTNTYRTMWKKMLCNTAQNTTTSSSSTQQSKSEPTYADTAQTAEQHTNEIKFLTTTLFCKKFKVKQLSWSRDFRFPVLAPQAVPYERAQKVL